MVRVHDYIQYQKIPKELVSKNIWQRRFNEINNFEKYLYDNGTVILKFFLHVSKEEQRKRFLARIDDASKNWKFSESDVKGKKSFGMTIKNVIKKLFQQQVKNMRHGLLSRRIKNGLCALQFQILLQKL